MKLRVSDGLVLGADFVTSTSAVLGKKRSGKTYWAQKIAEGLLAAKQQVVVIDLTSAWWGLRSSADGKSPGYPITIFGGRHGDVPLEATAGALLAEAIVADRFSAVLDVRLLKKGQRIRFIADFLEALYDKNTKAMHLFMDEADAYIPQRSFSPEEARALGAADELVRRGGIGGIGVTMISQRAQVLNKNVLSQVDTLSVLRMNHPKDIDAVEDWMSNHAEKLLIKEILASLSALPRGDAWYLDPEHKIFKRVTVAQKSTYDSGRTPKVGERVVPPKVLAKVDLEQLGARIAATVEQAKANDPKLLRAEAARWKKAHDELQAGMEREVQRQLSKTPGKAAGAIEKIKVVEKPVLKDTQLARTEKLIDRAASVVEKATARVEKTIEEVRGTFGAAIGRAEQALDELRAVVKGVSALPPATTTRPDTQRKPSTPPLVVKPPVVTAETKNGHNHSARADGLKPAHLRILSAIAWWESLGVSDPDFVGVAFVAGTSPKSSAFENNRSRLRAAGYLDYPSSGRFRLTEAGRAITPPPTMPTTNEALHEAVLAMTKSPAVGRLLRVLIDAYPNEVSFEDLAAGAGTSVASSAFENNRSWLRARGLSSYPRPGYARATELLFPETRDVGRDLSRASSAKSARQPRSS